MVAQVVDPPAVTFVDVTTAAGVSGQWFVPTAVIPGGGAVADFNKDGFQDLFVLGGFGGDRLFLNDGDGTFTDAMGCHLGSPGHRRGCRGLQQRWLVGRLRDQFRCWSRPGSAPPLPQ